VDKPQSLEREVEGEVRRLGGGGDEVVVVGELERPVEYEAEAEVEEWLKCRNK